MNNISICIACVCFIVVVAIAIQAAIVAVSMYNYVKVVVMSENNSVTYIIEEERFTTEYGGRCLLNVKEVKGFRRFDKVMYGKIKCYIFGLRSSGYFNLKTIKGEKI